MSRTCQRLISRTPMSASRVASQSVNGIGRARGRLKALSELVVQAILGREYAGLTPSEYGFVPSHSPARFARSRIRARRRKRLRFAHAKPILLGWTSDVTKPTS